MIDIVRLRIAIVEKLGWKSHGDSGVWIRDTSAHPYFAQNIGGYLNGELRALPNFCEDLNAAWQLVEWMRKEGWDFELLRLSKTEGSSARFDRFDVTMECHGAEAETAPLAICLAFAKANGIEVHESA